MKDEEREMGWHKTNLGWKIDALVPLLYYGSGSCYFLPRDAL